MAVRFHNALTGKLEVFSPAAAPLVDFRWVPAASQAERRREEALVASLLDALVFLGYTINRNVLEEEKADVCVSASAPKDGALWLKPGAVEGGENEGDAWRLLCLSVSYKAPLKGTGLEKARADLARLRSAVGGGRVAEPNSKGLAVYRQRFREALSNDFDTPSALAVLWDGLRPGALSPGSQAALVQEAGEALGMAL